MRPEDMLHTSLRESCDELFESIQLNLRAAVGRARGADVRGSQLAAMIGFLGPHIKGSLLIHAPVSFFAGTFPVATDDGEHTLRQLSDWAGEIANQLLGRMKNKLMVRGVHLSVTTPVMMFGDYLKGTDVYDGTLALTLPWHDGEISVRFDMKLGPEFQLIDQASDALRPVEAGEALIF